MPRIVLGVTGSVAAIRTPALLEGLRSLGHVVRIVATEPSLHFFDPSNLLADPLDPLGGPLFRDRDEWPESRWERDDLVLHIEMRRWADLLLVAPLDANTLAKFAFGLADNFLTCLFRAWDFGKPVILAPAMNTLMWDSRVTRRHLQLLLDDHGDGGPDTPWSVLDAASIFAQHSKTFRLIAPGSKRLACGDVGIGAMAEVAAIIEEVSQRLDQRLDAAVPSL